MKEFSRNVLKWIAVCAVAIAISGASSAAAYFSPIDVVASKDGKTLYVAEATAKTVAIFDIASGKVVKEIALPGRASEPSALALSPDGATLYAACGKDSGAILAIDLAAGTVGEPIRVGNRPSDVAVSPDGKTLYVTLQFDNTLAVVDIAAGKKTAEIPVSREPFAVAITPDGKTLFVANLLPATAADLDYVASVVTVIDTASSKVACELLLPNGSIDLLDVAVSPDGKLACVTHVLSRYQLPTTQLERGWMNTNALTIIDVAEKKLINTVLLDDVDLGAANPWGVAFTADGKNICVTHAGTHELSVIDKAGLLDKLAQAAAGKKVSDATSSWDDVPNDLAFLVGLRRRLSLPANGPRGLAIVGDKVYAAAYYGDCLTEININPDARPDAKCLSLGPKAELTVARQGEIYFHDANFCFQKWQSCSSCHPDARTDALNWDLLNDGMGNPKNTRSMLLAHKTPPSMVTGIRPDAETAVRAGLKFIQFAVRPEEDAVALDTYLKSLEPARSPHLNRGQLSKKAEQGKVIFEKADCARCHPSETNFTNLKKYNIGTGIDMEKDREFDTQTLVEIWRTSPYLYDGRAVTIKEVLTKYNKDDKHGTTSDLTTEEIDALAEYVMSL